MVRKVALAMVLWGSAAQAQMSTTNCIGGAGMVNCTTVGGGQQPYVDTDWGAVFQHMRDRHVQKKVAKMMSAGDCQGAYAYALQQSFELARQVREMCVAR